VTRLPERIETDSPLLIRRWLVSDAEALDRAIVESGDHLLPWMSWMAEEPQTLDQRRALIRSWEDDWSKGGDAYLGIFVEGRAAGSCGLHRRRGPDVLEVGYWIHADFLRRGLATAVAALLTDAALSVPEIERVEIHHDKANAASAGVPRRLGYQLVGDEVDGVSAPAEAGIDLTWSIERAEWESGHAATTREFRWPR
jgi:RimJ/RimL family protein N-acetyltransferase